MKQKKTVLLLILMGLAFTNSFSQESNFKFFGSYNYGFGNIIADVDSKVYVPEKEALNKLRSSTINQFELGAYYRRFGLGFVHNSYSKEASSYYQNVDINGDSFPDNGTISHKLDLSFNGLELLYRLPFSNLKFDFVWKIAIGKQSYSIENDYKFTGKYFFQSNYSITGSKLTTMYGMEMNYQIWKIIGIGVEASFLPGNYTDLKNSQSPTSTYTDNVSRLSTGIKLKITI